MSLIEQELEKRNKRISFKSKMSNGFNSAKSKIKNRFEEIKTQQTEQRNFNKKIKTIEKRSYRRSLQKEAKKAGGRRAKAKYRSKKSNISKLSGLLGSGTPGFMEMPGTSKKKKKEDNAFNMF